MQYNHIIVILVQISVCTLHVLLMYPLCTSNVHTIYCMFSNKHFLWIQIFWIFCNKKIKLSISDLLVIVAMSALLSGYDGKCRRGPKGHLRHSQLPRNILHCLHANKYSKTSPDVWWGLNIQDENISLTAIWNKSFQSFAEPLD